MNRLLLTDSYKLTHWRQYPPGTEHVYSYLESRGGLHEEVVVFGLRYILDTYLAEPITDDEVLAASGIVAYHMGQGKTARGHDLFNGKGWRHIIDHHGGRLPIRIRAVPEGTVVPVGNVMMTVENTCPRCAWVTNYIESLLLHVWYGSTVATVSREVKRVIREALRITGDEAQLPYKLHDFGFRGVSSVESAAVGGAAHLVNFHGTDTLPAIDMLMRHYGLRPWEMPGESIPASEHSTITSWGRAREVDAYRNMLEQYPDALLACVSDSWDIYAACSDLWGGVLRDAVMRREGTLVVRPDSGEPAVVVPKVLGILGNKFGTEINSKGYRVLDPHVRVIQGDGMTPETIRHLLSVLRHEGWSADNIAFGMGGGLLQHVNRDTQRFAFKCSQVTINGEQVNVYKDPVTDAGKRSKRGRMALVRRGGTMSTVPRSMVAADEDLLRDAYMDGAIMGSADFGGIRERAALPD